MYPFPSFPSPFLPSPQTEKDKERAHEFGSFVQKMIDDTIEDNFYDKFGDYVSRICELARTYAVKLDPNYFHIAMALKV